MNSFVEIAKGHYLDSKQIKCIVDCTNFNRFVQNMIKSAKNNDKLRKEELDKLEALKEKGYESNIVVPYKKRYFAHAAKTDDGKYRYIITKNNELHSSDLSLIELKSRCRNSGIKLIDMSDLACLNLSYIDGIIDIEREEVSSTRTMLSSETAMLQFVSGVQSKVRTILWLKTNEMIKLSKKGEEIIAQISEIEG